MPKKVEATHLVAPTFFFKLFAIKTRLYMGDNMSISTKYCRNSVSGADSRKLRGIILFQINYGIFIWRNGIIIM